MAYKINASDCAACGACESECPNGAIKLKGAAYVINADKCTECAESEDGPHCAAVCPSDACVQA